MDASRATPPRGIAEVRARFGDVTVTRDYISGPPHWESRNMIMLPSLPGWDRKLYVNRQIAGPLTRALVACSQLDDGYQIRTLGCFAPRLKRVNGDLSLHSWGVAVDLNADANPLAPIGGHLVTDIPPEWVACFEGEGFTWGGRWVRPDAMHLQWATGY